MLQPAFADRNRRGITQGFALDQGPEIVMQFSSKPVPICNLGSSLFGSSFTASIDLDFSSFIIGEGVVTAAFILTVR